MARLARPPHQQRAGGEHDQSEGKLRARDREAEGPRRGFDQPQAGREYDRERRAGQYDDDRRHAGGHGGDVRTRSQAPGPGRGRGPGCRPAHEEGKTHGDRRQHGALHECCRHERPPRRPDRSAKSRFGSPFSGSRGEQQEHTDRGDRGGREGGARQSLEQQAHRLGVDVVRGAGDRPAGLRRRGWGHEDLQPAAERLSHEGDEWATGNVAASPAVAIATRSIAVPRCAAAPRPRLPSLPASSSALLVDSTRDQSPATARHS